MEINTSKYLRFKGRSSRLPFQGLVLATMLTAAAALCGAVEQLDLRTLDLNISLPEGWMESDASSDTLYLEDAVVGDSLFQGAYEKLIALPSDAKERATLILTAQMGARPFSTSYRDMKRMEKDLTNRMTPSKGARQVDSFLAITLPGNNPAMEARLSGRIDGRPYRQIMLSFTGADYSYMISFQGFEAGWPVWEKEWRQIVDHIQILKPYDWPRGGLYLKWLALIVAGMFLLGLLTRSRRMRKVRVKH